MKYLLVTDSHLGLYGDSEAWHMVVLNLFKDICDTCERENIDTIIHLGDFFHNRKAINTKTQSIAHDIANLLRDFQTYIIIGNHDAYYRNIITPNSLQFLDQYKNINIIDVPTPIDDDTILMPWSSTMPYSGRKYCMGHFQIQGFYMNDNYICQRGINAEKLKGYEAVYSGHFHAPSQHGNITYLGAPYQQTFNDKNGARGYYIWDDGELNFIENTRSPKFIEMHTNNIMLNEVKGNVVKLTFDKDYGTLQNEQIIDSVIKKEPMKMKINFSEVSFIDEEEEINEEIKLLEHDDIIKEYIEKKCTPPENIDKNMLLNIIRKLTGEIRNE